jgi:hypothetical protein
MRFTTRAMLFVIALVGLYAAISLQADGGVTPAGAAGVGALISLMGWAVFGTGSYQYRNDALPKESRKDE